MDVVTAERLLQHSLGNSRSERRTSTVLPSIFCRVSPMVSMPFFGVNDEVLVSEIWRSKMLGSKFQSSRDLVAVRRAWREVIRQLVIAYLRR